MHGLLLAAGLLSLPLHALAHPHTNSSPAVYRRGAVDLDAYRLPLKAKYTNADEVENNPPSISAFGASSYVDVASALVKETYPDLTFRVVPDHYVGDNGVAHVHFRQTIHGLDVDNADFNVNVCWTNFHYILLD